jgi:gamma-aminobutyric acid type B receptor
MATPWLLSMGACIIFSALFSKLWRLNRLLDTGFRRIALKEKDVIAPAAALFIMNLIILICWSAISPLQWQRVSVAGQPWNTIGVCMSQNKAVEIGCWAVLGSINFGALLLCFWQAYKARIHSDEFSEAKGIGMAMFSWLQLTLIGLPVLLLIDQDDVTARYFVTVGLVFLACMSLLFCIFIPI